MNDIKVLVLMAVYNGAPWLHEQLDSILQQENVSVHILIRDDNSSDSTLKILEQYRLHESRITLLTASIGSGSAGNNFRLLFEKSEAFDYDYVALADQDDIWYSKKLATAISSLDNLGADGYSCAAETFSTDGTSRTLLQSEEMRLADFLFEGAGQGCTFVLRGNFFSRVREYCVNNNIESSSLHYHDWLIYLLARSWKLKWHFDPQPWIRYRQHANNEIGARGGSRSIFRRLKMIKNGWYSKQISTALSIYLNQSEQDQKIVKFANVFSGEKSIVRNFKICWFSFHYARRRFSDRFVIVVVAALGWI